MGLPSGSSGSGLSPEQQAAVAALARTSVTDFTTWPAGWRMFGATDSSSLNPPGSASNACVSVAATNVVLKCAHPNSDTFNDSLRGNGISKNIDLSESWTVTVAFENGTNFATPTGQWYSLRVAIVLGGGRSEGCWFGPVLYYYSGATGDEGWQWNKFYKPPGTGTQSYGTTAWLNHDAGNPPNTWGQLEWAASKGFIASYSEDGESFTAIEVTGDAGYLDVFGGGTTRPQLLNDAQLVIMVGTGATIGTAADAWTVGVKEIIFT